MYKWFKSGKRAYMCLALFGVGLVLICAYGCMGKESRADDAEKQGEIKVKAWIDDECRSRPATFTVPEGKTAHSFKSSGLEAGKACHEGGAPENKGFAIRDAKNQPVYMWSQYKDQKPYEKGGPLGSLTLAAGEYTLSVAGGAGAKVEISYKLK